ncbi:MAG TPA: CHRD domain-containing protein [Burkholderiales bacterium]|nr:CHRD domain-containing protein [Burkholderiales bacterium]
MTRFAAFVVPALTMLLLGSASHANIISYEAALSRPNKSPPNDSRAMGFAVVTLDTFANPLRVQVSFSDLRGTTTASHIDLTRRSDLHCVAVAKRTAPA